MSDERKKALWPWIAALLIGLPVLYIASFGPACWISSRAVVIVPIVNFAYLPVMWIWDVSPASVGDVLEWYAKFGAAEGRYWTMGNTWVNRSGI